MRKLFVVILALGFAVALTSYVGAECTTIQDGTLVASTGELLETGYDEFGYNYQAHMYNGWYCEYIRVPCPTEYTVQLMMKWSDEWLSNKDCNGDGELDRGYSCDPDDANNSGCPGAWLTNHMSGWVEVDGKQRKWTYFVKIVAAPEDAYVDNERWYTVDGVEIGPVIWGAFAIVEEVSNDPSLGEHGILYKSPAGPGFGQYQPQQFLDLITTLVPDPRQAKSKGRVMQMALPCWPIWRIAAIGCQL